MKIKCVYFAVENTDWCMFLWLKVFCFMTLSARSETKYKHTFHFMRARPAVQMWRPYACFMSRTRLWILLKSYIGSTMKWSYQFTTTRSERLMGRSFLFVQNHSLDSGFHWYSLRWMLYVYATVQW
jgi:hypothetical protein